MGLKEDQELYYKTKADSIRWSRGCGCLFAILLLIFLIWAFTPQGDENGEATQPTPSTQANIVTIQAVRDKYGKPDAELGVPGSPIYTNPDTGYEYDKRWLYYFKESKDPKNPDKRIVFIKGDQVTGIAVFYNDGPIEKESIANP